MGSKTAQTLHEVKGSLRLDVAKQLRCFCACPVQILMGYCISCKHDVLLHVLQAVRDPAW